MKKATGAPSIFPHRALFCAAAALMACGVAHAAQSHAYPSKPIRFIVPYSAGGTTDLVARTVGAHMTETLGQPVVVENRGGAGGNIGMDAVAKAAPDGYTIGMGAISTNALNPHIYKTMAFDPRTDFSAIGMLGHSTIVLEVNPKLPVKNVSELIAYATQNRGTHYATAGTGTSMHLAGVLFSQLSKSSMEHVAYKGSAPLLTDLIAGHVNVAFDNLPASLPHIQAGSLRALAVAGSERSPALPDVPTMKEAGLADYAVVPWFGVYGPAKMPEKTVETLEKALRAALEDPSVKAKLSEAGFSPKASTAKELAELSSHEYERLREVVKATGMTTQ